MKFPKTTTALPSIEGPLWQGSFAPGGGQVVRNLPRAWRAVFERSFGSRLEHVAVVAGPETDDCLAATGALAQAIDGATILLTSQFPTMPAEVQLWLIGHELAHTIQLGRYGSDAEDVLEREAWDAAYYALHGQRYAITGSGSKPLSAAAFVLDRMAVHYFQTFPQLLDLRISHAREIRPLTFERILQLMLDSDQKDFVIDVHGSAKGLSIPLARGTEISAVKQSLVMLLQIDHIQREAQEAGDDIRRWRRILRIIQSPQADSISQVENARSAVQDWITRRVTALGLSAARVQALIDAMLRLQAKEIRKIEFRSCKMGQDLDALATFREFFEAQRVGAPDVRSGIATVRPQVGRGPMQALLRLHPQAQIAHMADASRFGLRLRISPSPSTDVMTFAAADSWGAVRQWIAMHMMGGTRYRSGGFPIHFLETDPPVFPADREYRSHIKHSSHIWYTEEGGAQAPRTSAPSFWERVTR
jgi:Domain of unknown function (DUF4157)